MTQERPTIFPPPAHVQKQAHIKSLDEYRMWYEQSIAHPENFWARIAERLDWFERWHTVLEWDFNVPKIAWFCGGKLNACFNCVDRHVAAGKGNKPAIIWVGNEPTEQRRITYSELFAEVQRAANALRSLGVTKGDRVAIYMQMVPELPIAMLACARIGAIHSVIFGAFAPDAVAKRINDAECKVLITQDTGPRGTKREPMKVKTDQALTSCPTVESVLVVRRTGDDVPMQDGRDHWWDELLATVAPTSGTIAMDSEDPLFILYTSGTTGKPKGMVHTTGGYLVGTSLSHEYVFDVHDNDVYLCTADIGWVTGHSYVVYGPLANGATTVMLECPPTYPTPDRLWQIVDDLGVTQLYTAPTAIRAFAKAGSEWPAKYKLSSLRVLGTVGEPIDEEAWHWYHEHIGRGQCAIVDTWWQTETGSIMITPLPGATPTKPAFATRPFFGVDPVVLDEQGNELEGAARGILAIKHPWPAMARTIWKDHERFRATYFRRFPGYYFPTDGCIRDAEGDFRVIGRLDDIIIVSGHNISTAETEEALMTHPAVAEAAVAGPKDALTGKAIYCFVILHDGYSASDELRRAIGQTVRERIGPFATPKAIQFVDKLPKTQSAKTMRRLLLLIAEGNAKQLAQEDISTLEDKSVPGRLLEGRIA